MSLLESIETSALAVWMRETNAVMPIVESTHVLAAVMVFGTVLIVDLRLLGFCDVSRTFARLGREILPWTWLAFTVAVITGSLMFSTSAEVYFANTAFRLKALALLCAGLNMALFQLATARRLETGDARSSLPGTARVAGGVSLLLWAAVVLLGRWIGFTKGYDFALPPGVEELFPG